VGRTQVRWARALLAAALVGSLVAATGGAALGRGREADGATAGRTGGAEARLVVRPGDTLWEIARALVGPEGDPRPVVQRIREANRLTPSQALLPGTSLVVPAF
jgi:nucleoid-associated protein YgaU